METFLAGWADAGMQWDAWIAEVERARAVFAHLIGAQPHEIAVGSSVSQLVSSLTSALSGSRDRARRRIISSVAEFPGVAHAWLALRQSGYQVDLLAASAEGVVCAQDFQQAIDETTALLSVPHVCYANGMMVDLASLAQAAHAHGALVFIDAYQSIGTVPIDVTSSGVDFLAAGTLKYLLGTAGIAFLYVNPDLIERLEPTVTGWFGRTNPFAFEPARLDYAATAARFDLGTPPIIAAYAASAGMQLILDTGVACIRDHIETLSALAYRLASERGVRVLGPRSVQEKGATTAIDAGNPERARWLEHELHRRCIIASARGRAIRLAPHGFTCEEEVEQALSVVAELLA